MPFRLFANPGEVRLFPPWEEVWHAIRDFHGIDWLTLFKEAHHAFTGIIRLAARIDRGAVHDVRFHRMTGAEHTPHHMTGQRG